MNASNIYVTLRDGTPIKGELNAPEGCEPQANLVIGALINDARCTLSFTSLAQIGETVDALCAVEAQWREHIRSQRIAEAQRRREADFGDLLANAQVAS